MQPRTRRSTARPLLLARVDGLHAERHLTVAVLTKRPASYAAPERELITLMKNHTHAWRIVVRPDIVALSYLTYYGTDLPKVSLRLQVAY